MTRETQIGLTLILVLCGVFGFFVYKKVSGPAAVAQAETPDDKDQPVVPDEGKESGQPSAEPKQPAAPEPAPPIATDEDFFNVKTASATRSVAAAPSTGTPRIPVEPRPSSIPDDDGFGGPPPTVAAAQPGKPRLPTTIPGDEDAFGARTESPDVAARPSTKMEVASATVPSEEEDPFGAAAPPRAEPAVTQPAPRGAADVAASDEFGFGDAPANPVRLTQPESGEAEADPFGAPVAETPARPQPKLPTLTDDSLDSPSAQPVPAAAAPFGVPANNVAMEAAETSAPRTAAAAREEEFGFGDAPAEKPNPVRLDLPVAEEANADPFGASEVKTTDAMPASLGEPEFDPQPAARTSPPPRLPTAIEENDPAGFEPPVQLEQPESVEMTRSAAVEADPFGTASAESTTEVQRDMPAENSFGAQPSEPELTLPARVIEEAPRGGQPRPAPTLPLEEADDFPAVRPAAPVRSVPRPVAVDLPQPGAITADQHVVEPNQNFWSLSKRRYGEGRFAEALAAHNKQAVPDPQAIQPGTIVSLPPARLLEQQYADLVPKAPVPEVDPASIAAGPGQYVIQDGDSFWKISKKVYGDHRYWDALQRHNSETAKLPALKPGTIISAPPVAVLEQKFANAITAPAPEPTVPSGVTLAGAPAKGQSGLFDGNDGQPLYRVADGDTLSGIAKSTLGRSSRWVQILHLNRETVKDGNRLVPGTVLRMPADASQVQMSSLERDRR